MHEESCRLPKIDQKTKRRERYEVLRADRSTASSRSKSVAVKVGAKLVAHWWERPEFADKFMRCDRDPACESCLQFNEHQLHLLKLRRKFPPIKHVLSDFAHRYAKLQRHEVKLPKKVRKDFFHGIQASDVTSFLRKSTTSCSRHQGGTTEWFGIQSSDVTKHLDGASRGPRPPSREYSFGIQPTDVTEHTRVVPPSALPQTDDEESREFFIRPKTDVTNFDILPRRIEDKKWRREEELRPLGRARLLHAPRTHRLSLHFPDQTFLNAKLPLRSHSSASKKMLCRHEPSCSPCYDYNQKRGLSSKPELDKSCGYILLPPVKGAVCQVVESCLHKR